ncbi:MAG: STN domain-containing protein [Lentimicrobium sp.]|nr:STN domain-containing protein [Lentimicrobium sp.]
MLPLLISAQSGRLNEPLTLKAQNEPLGQVLDRITRNTGITFSYNPDHIKAEQKVSIDVVQKPLHEILSMLLDKKLFDFRANGNQIVLFRHTTPEVAVAREIPLAVPSVPEPDTIVRTDTVYVTKVKTVTDTLLVKETTTVFDTVYILRKSPEEKVGKEQIFRNIESLEKSLTRVWKFRAGPMLSFYSSSFGFSGNKLHASKISDYTEVHQRGPLSWTAGISAEASYARFAITSGIGFTALVSNFRYNYELEEGGYFRRDTLDTYYITDPPQTVYIIDSTYIPVDLKQYRYDSRVRHNYVDIPVLFSYRVPVGSWLVYGQAGIIAGIHAGSSGLYILTDGPEVNQISKLKMQPLLFSYSLSAGIQAPVTRRILFTAGLNYRSSFKSAFSDFPIQVKPTATGINAGLLYFL